MSTTEAEWQARANQLIAAANDKDREIAALKAEVARRPASPDDIEAAVTVALYEIPSIWHQDAEDREVFRTYVQLILAAARGAA